MMTPPLNILARPSLTVKLEEVLGLLGSTLVEGSFSCVEVDVGLVVLAGGLLWVGVGVEALARVEEESLMAMSCEVKEQQEDVAD